MKKLKSEKGSALLESIVGLAIISVVIFTLLPLYTSIQEKLLSRKNEVEMWRLAQDHYMRIVADKNNPFGSGRFSSGNQYSSVWNDQQHSLTITSSGGSMIYIERTSIQ